MQRTVSKKRQKINANLVLQVRFIRKQAEMELRAPNFYWSVTSVNRKWEEAGLHEEIHKTMMRI